MMVRNVAAHLIRPSRPSRILKCHSPTHIRTSIFCSNMLPVWFRRDRNLHRQLNLPNYLRFLDLQSDLLGTKCRGHRTNEAIPTTASKFSCVTTVKGHRICAAIHRRVHGALQGDVLCNAKLIIQRVREHTLTRTWRSIVIRLLSTAYAMLKSSVDFTFNFINVDPAVGPRMNVRAN